MPVKELEISDSFRFDRYLATIGRFARRSLIVNQAFTVIAKEPNFQ